MSKAIVPLFFSSNVWSSFSLHVYTLRWMFFTQQDRWYFTSFTRALSVLIAVVLNWTFHFRLLDFSTACWRCIPALKDGTSCTISFLISWQKKHNLALKGLTKKRVKQDIWSWIELEVSTEGGHAFFVHNDCPLVGWLSGCELSQPQGWPLTCRPITCPVSFCSHIFQISDSKMS